MNPSFIFLTLVVNVKMANSFFVPSSIGSAITNQILTSRKYINDKYYLYLKLGLAVNSFEFHPTKEKKYRMRTK